MTPKTVTCHGCLEEKRPDSVCVYEGKTLCVDCFVKAATPTQPETPTAEDDRYCDACSKEFGSAEYRYGTGQKFCRDCFLEHENADGLCDICDAPLSGPGWLCETNRCCEGCARTWAEEIAPTELNTLRGEAAEAASLKAAANEAADRRKFYESCARTDLRCALDTAFGLAKRAANEFESLRGWLAEAITDAAFPNADLASLTNIAANVTSRLQWVSQYGPRTTEVLANCQAVDATLQTLRNLGPNNKA